MRRMVALCIATAAVIVFSGQARAEKLKHAASPFTDRGEGTHAPGQGVGYDAAKTDALKRDLQHSHEHRAKEAGLKEKERARGYESRIKEREESHKKTHGGIDETYAQ